VFEWQSCKIGVYKGARFFCCKTTEPNVLSYTSDFDQEQLQCTKGYSISGFSMLVRHVRSYLERCVGHHACRYTYAFCYVRVSLKFMIRSGLSSPTDRTEGVEGHNFETTHTQYPHTKFYQKISSQSRSRAKKRRSSPRSNSGGRCFGHLLYLGNFLAILEDVVQNCILFPPTPPLPTRICLVVNDATKTKKQLSSSSAVTGSLGHWMRLIDKETHFFQ